MSRRSERLKSQTVAEVKRQILDSPPPDSDSEYEPEWDLPKLTAPRRRNTGAKRAKGKRIRGKRGILQRMLDMPLDVLFEIFAHLHPMDLLNLARTTKDFRSFLMKPSASQFWRATRENVDGLPPCPQDLSEPAYANLLFDAHCHVCLQKNCQTVYWECRVRLCKKCFRDMAVDYPHMMLGDRAAAQNHLVIYDIVPMLYDSNDYPRGYKPVVDELTDSLAGLAPDDVTTYLKAQKERVTTIKDTIAELSMWYNTLRENRIDELDNLRGERWQQILEKLTELGWQDELDFLDSGCCYHSLRHLPEVKKPQLLTPRVWQNIEQRVLSFMASIRGERLERERKKTLEQRLRTLERIVRKVVPKFSCDTPSPLEIAARNPEILGLMEAPSDQFDEEHLEKVVRDIVPGFIEKRYSDARDYFAGLIRDEYDLPADVDPTTLAIAAYFSCTHPNCGTSQGFPAVLSHVCGRRREALNENQGEFVGYVLKSVFPSQRVWCQSGYRSNAKRLAEYVRAYGLDPTRATVADMEASNVRLRCPTHGQNSTRPERAIITWHLAYRSCGTECHPERAPDDQAAAARELEPKVRAICQETQDRQYEWRCAHCTSVNAQPKSSMRAHLLACHAISEAAEDDWYPDHNGVSFPPVPGPVYLVSNELKDTDLDWTTRHRISNGTAAFFAFGPSEHSSEAAR